MKNIKCLFSTTIPNKILLYLKINYTPNNTLPSYLLTFLMYIQNTLSYQSSHRHQNQPSKMQFRKSFILKTSLIATFLSNHYHFYQFY